MTGIYIHVPFCVQRCHYCDFFSSIRLKDRDIFTDTLLKEISHRKDFISDKNVDTIYFGGGTPSLLSAEAISKIIKEIERHFKLVSDAEITLEANPDDLDAPYLNSISETGINRLSIGIQSFKDEDLTLLNRRHNSREALDAVELAKNSGFDSISIDLIYGLPGQSVSSWEDNLRLAADMPVEHISAYHLTYEKGTRFYKWLKEGKLKEPHDELSLKLFQSAIDISGEKGFEHYEISNFARDKKYSRHNTKYWFGEEYLGLGPSAHSFNGEVRQWNISNLDIWLMYDKNNTEIIKTEHLYNKMRRNELIMTRLRTKWGIDRKEFTELFGQEAWGELLCLSEHHVDRGLLSAENECLMLTARGKFLADGIITDLFII